MEIFSPIDGSGDQNFGQIRLRVSIDIRKVEHYLQFKFETDLRKKVKPSVGAPLLE